VSNKLKVAGMNPGFCTDDIIYPKTDDRFTPKAVLPPKQTTAKHTHTHCTCIQVNNGFPLTPEAGYPEFLCNVADAEHTPGNIIFVPVNR
jgi:hypothetical protein